MFKYKVDSQDGYLLSFLKSDSDLNEFLENVDILFPMENPVVIERGTWDLDEVKCDYLFSEYTVSKDGAGEVKAIYNGHLELSAENIEHCY